MKPKQPKTKKDKIELAIQKKIIDKILDGGKLKDIIKIIKTNLKNDWKKYLLKKVTIISVF